SESATIPWSSANLTSFSNFPPTITPASMSSMASIIIASAYTVNNNGDKQHPCRTPLPTTLGSEHFSPMRTVAICSIYKLPMSLLSRQSTPILFNTSNIFTQFTLSTLSQNLQNIQTLHCPTPNFSHIAFSIHQLPPVFHNPF